MIKGYGIIFVRRDGERAPLSLPGTWRLDEAQAQAICDGLNADPKNTEDGVYCAIEVDDDMVVSDEPIKLRRPRAV